MVETLLSVLLVSEDPDVVCDVVVARASDAVVESVVDDVVVCASEASVVDASVVEASVVDTSVVDASVVDTSVVEMSVVDTSVVVTSVVDTSVVDTSVVEMSVVEVVTTSSFTARSLPMNGRSDAYAASKAQSPEACMKSAAIQSASRSHLGIHDAKVSPTE